MRPGWFAYVVTTLVVVCMLMPLAVVIGASFNAGSEIAFPPKDFSLRWYANAFQRERFLSGFRFSLLLAVTTTLLSLTRQLTQPVLVRL